MLALAPGFEAGDAFALGLAFLGVVLFVAIAALSHEHERAFSAAIFYLALGLVAAFGLPALGLEQIDPLRQEVVLERVAELALVTAVFAAGLAVHRAARRSWTTVAVLLFVVMPLCIALVALFATQAMGLSIAAAVLLGAVLAPTDPVLAGSVGLSPPGDEEQGEPRFSLHTEAGINDGLASPFVVLGLFMAEQGGTGWLGEWALVDVLYAAGVAAAGGLLAGRAVAAATVWARRRELLAPELDGFVALAAALLVYGATELIGGYGLLAVFAAGFAFRRYEYEHVVNRRVHDGADRIKTFLELSVVLLLGSMVTLEGLREPGLAGWLIAPLLIVVLRPALVIPLVGRGHLALRERAFVALFGVRGVAALFYAEVVVAAGVLSEAEASVLFWTTAVVVMVSLVVHGIAATPLTRRLA